METRDTNNLVTAKKVSPITAKKDFPFWMKTQTATTHSPDPYTHRKVKANAKLVYSNTRQTEVGSVWHVASQEVNHDWLTMVVPGSVADHWLA